MTTARPQPNAHPQPTARPGSAARPRARGRLPRVASAVVGCLAASLVVAATPAVPATASATPEVGVQAPAGTPAPGPLPDFERASVDLGARGGFDRSFDVPPPVADHAEHEHLDGVAPDGVAPGWSVEADLPIPGEFVVLEWEGDGHVAFAVRSHDDRGWTDWVAVHAEVDERPDAGAEPDAPGHSIGPIHVGGGTDRVEVAVTEGAPEGLSMLVMRSVEPEGWVDPAPLPSARTTASGVAALTTGLPAKPAIYGTSAWGSKGWSYSTPGCESGPRQAPSLRFAIVHHTVSTNSYAASEADDQIRAIRDYHVNSNGWCDIAYNFVVDKYGTVWEGRTSSIAFPIQGGHAAGFNSGSVGVVLLGQYHPGASPPAISVSTAQYQGLRDVISWKFGLHAIDAKGTTTETSGGSSSIPAGQVVTLSTIIGHRNVSSTSCPGDNAFLHLPALRNDVAARVAAAPELASRTAAARNKDGRLEVFGLGGTGQVRHGWQNGPNGVGGWNGWHLLNPSHFLGGISAQENKDGRIEVFTRDAAGRVHHAWQTTPNGLWSSFQLLGHTTVADPAAGIQADGRLSVYVTGTDGRVWQNHQASAGSHWTSWTAVGGGGFTNAPATGSNKDGRQEILVIAPDGQAWHAWQNTPNGSWSAFHPFGGSLKGDGSVATNVDGRLELFAVGTDGQIWHNFQWAANGSKGWSGWLPMGGSFDTGPSVVLNADGRLELFAYGADGRLWHNWQWSASGGAGWSGWWPLTSTPVR